MRISRAALSAAFAAALAAAPASADAAILAPDRACYGPGESILLEGTGFTPNADVTLRSEGFRLATLGSDPDGAFTVRVEVPTFLGDADLRFSARDGVDRLLTGQTAVRTTSVGVEVFPAGGLPWRPRRIVARGFMDVPAVYAHIRRRGSRHARNVFLGRPRGACGTLSVRKRLFGRGIRPGAYRLQFDANPRYLAGIEPSVTYSVAVR